MQDWQNRHRWEGWRNRGLLILFFWTSILFSPPPLSAKLAHQPIIVEPGGASFRQTLAAAPPGSSLFLKAGVHLGPAILDKPITLTGEAGAILDGEGQGSVLTVSAAHVTIQHLQIQNSGTNLRQYHSGIHVGKGANNVHIENNTLINNLFGIYLRGAQTPYIRGNRIEGRSDLRMAERGDGIAVWDVQGAVIEKNDFYEGRDGIFINVSHGNTLKNNHFSHLRFAIHYMYSHDNEISDNVSEHNDIGFALMFSNGLKIFNNYSKNDKGNGLMFNYTNGSVIGNNRVESNREKCLFLYNSSNNIIYGNQFQRCQIGIHFTAGSEHNQIYGNAFIENRIQVKYIGTRFQQWSKDGRGNYWSDHPAFDLNGDGVADGVYRPNDRVDQIMWRYPWAKLLLNSPAIQLLRAAQSHFPALLPGGVTDSYPLMRPAL